MIADHRCQLKTVDVGHIDVDKDDGDVMLQQELKSLGGVACAQQIFADILEDRSICQKLRGLIVDKKYVDFFIEHGVLALSDATNCGVRIAAVPCSPALPDNRMRPRPGISRDRLSSPLPSAR